MLINWDAEKIIWDRLFSPQELDVNPPETSLLVTEPYFNLPNIAEAYDQMVFEEWEFASYFRCPRQLCPSSNVEVLKLIRDIAAALIPYGGLFGETEAPPECMLVVDVGYSYSHVVPFRDGQIIWEHVKRCV